MTLFIKRVEEGLQELEIPVLYKLPKASVREPFAVIGSHSTVDFRTAKTGFLIEDASLNVDIYLSNNSRTEAEEVRSKAVRVIGRKNKAERAMGRSSGIDSRMMLDNSIGREVYHIAIRITEIIV